MAFQTFTATKLAQAAITTSAVTIYTVPASTRTMVKSIIIANTITTSLALMILVMKLRYR